MNRIDYNTFVEKLTKEYPLDQAMELAVGGQFEAMGLLQKDLLIGSGLRPEHSIVDVGCGSGRLAKQLDGYLTGEYLGIDVVPALVDYGRSHCRRPEWRFEVATDLQIPAEDSSADLVCFFSVFTHLRHEESYLYLREAKRVLKPKGKVVFSFLEFLIPSQWHVFEIDLQNRNAEVPINQFMSRDAITAWAAHLGLEVEAVHDGDKPHISLNQPVSLADGLTFQDRGFLGQSVCVLSV